MNAILSRLNNVSVNRGYQYRKKYFTLKVGAGDDNANIFYIKFSLRPLFSFIDYEAFSTSFNWSLRFVKDGRLFFGATGSTNADITISFEECKIQIPKITPTTYFEIKLIKQITSDKKAKASVLDRKFYSINIRDQNKYDWGITTVSNNPRYAIITFKDNAIVDNILQNNSKYIVYQDADNYTISTQLIVNDVRYPIDPISFVNEGGELNIQQGFEYYSKLTSTFNNLCPID